MSKWFWLLSVMLVAVCLLLPACGGDDDDDDSSSGNDPVDDDDAADDDDDATDDDDAIDDDDAADDDDVVDDDDVIDDDDTIDDDDDSAPEPKHTVYVLGNINSAFFNFPLVVYTVAGNDLILADTLYWNSRALGPVGLAVDETRGKFFISQEGSAIIDSYDASTAMQLGNFWLQGTSDLAGMVVHETLGELYVVDRGYPTVYVFDSATFTLKAAYGLTNCAGAYGLALMGDWLFVSDHTATVRYYNVANLFQEVGSFTLSQIATGIAVTDYPEPIIISGTWYDTDPTVQTANLSIYYLNSGIEATAVVGDIVKGVTINPALELAYVTYANEVAIVDLPTATVINRKPLQNSGWTPTDIIASFASFSGTVKKTCTSHPSGNIIRGDSVVFEIEIQNRHTRPIHEFALRDTYDNTQLHFVSSTPPTDDSNDDGIVDWSDVIAQVGSDLASGAKTKITVNFTAIEDCDDILTGTNLAEMFDVVDDLGNEVPDASGSYDYSIICKCLSNAECDDGVFCNGEEICNAEGKCESPGNPCPIDDGVFCNGEETSDCDEETESCGHSGPPCPDDGLFCNGDETCDEEIDLCVSSGSPCPSDSTCNEDEDTCEMPPSDDPTPTPTPEPAPEDKDEGIPDATVTGGCCGCGDV